MADCFISYSSQDEKIADFVQVELNRKGINTFKASTSILPGQNWSTEILTNLRNSNWVIFLASRSACRSEFVNQEIGGALLTSKKLIPIVWDMAPSELPGWAKQMQAIDLRNLTMEDLRIQIEAIAGQIKQQKAQGYIIAGTLVLALLLFGSNS